MGVLGGGGRAMILNREARESRTKKVMFTQRSTEEWKRARYFCWGCSELATMEITSLFI